MPTPKLNEKQDEYIGRCVKQIMAEGKTQDQALGQCEGMWRQAKKTEILKSLDDAMNVLKARTVEGFESPEPGNLPEAGKRLLAKVYAECRKSGKAKENCAKTAWSAVNNAGYKSLDKNKIEKIFKSLEMSFDCNCKKAVK